MKIVAEIGINHNGNIELAKKLIDMAKFVKCDMVKFQKRTINKVYTQEELDKPRESPWGKTNREQKTGLELHYADYKQIQYYTTINKIPWFASPWDIESVDFISDWAIPYIKVASASITDFELLDKVRATKIPVIMSTGMSTRKEVWAAVDFLGSQLEYILACTSTYPTLPEEQNLNFIKTLQFEFPKHKIGFSNHSPGIIYCAIAAALGVEMIEYHITLDRSMYGSDQKASIELAGALSINKYCKTVPLGMGDGSWTVYLSEEGVKKKLRR